ncbi:hypothetical protein NNC19_07320 [Clostridium sp. SHJSY1]|uniref:hypothetical protein n=1 Tax=Clostridium sp. SHJSY1 TaxID=2942483 RepID=UPI002875F6B1|nr:hypothetical protein [Clostridium sp. SHJSY1]MDS0525484.1 hypothetical protein [Clostridium sp. SHJSY1]
MKHKKVSEEEISKIIETRKPLGTFYTIENDFYVAVDNLTGDAWTEDFTNKKDCLNYLDESGQCQTWSNC